MMPVPSPVTEPLPLPLPPRSSAVPKRHEKPLANINKRFFAPGAVDGQNSSFMVIEDGRLDAAMCIAAMCNSMDAPYPYRGTFLMPSCTDGEVSTVVHDPAYAGARAKLRAMAYTTMFPAGNGMLVAYKDVRDTAARIRSVWPAPNSTVRLVCLGGTWGILADVLSTLEPTRTIRIDIVHDGHLMPIEAADLEAVMKMPNVFLAELNSACMMRHVPMNIHGLLSDANYDATDPLTMPGPHVMLQFARATQPERLARVGKEIMALSIDQVIAKATVDDNTALVDAAVAVIKETAALPHDVFPPGIEAALRDLMSPVDYDNLRTDTSLSCLALAYVYRLANGTTYGERINMLEAEPFNAWGGRYMRPRLIIPTPDKALVTIGYWRQKVKSWVMEMLIV